MTRSAKRRGARVGDAQAPWPASTSYLLDVNVLIALLDPLHPHHLAAHAWFGQRQAPWASCAITQNGYLRIASNPRYSNPLSSTAEASQLLADLCRRPDHRFWPCDLSLLDSAIIDPTRFGSATQVTDTYLLALAVVRGGKLATFDRRLMTDTVNGGREALHLIVG